MEVPTCSAVPLAGVALNGPDGAEATIAGFWLSVTVTLNGPQLAMLPVPSVTVQFTLVRPLLNTTPARLRIALGARGLASVVAPLRL